MCARVVKLPYSHKQSIKKVVKLHGLPTHTHIHTGRRKGEGALSARLHDSHTLIYKLLIYLFLSVFAGGEDVCVCVCVGGGMCEGER